MSANDYVKPEHLRASRWVALPQLEADGELASWQDVSVMPEGQERGFTIALSSTEALEADFEAGEGPHPRELLPKDPGEAFALDTGRMAVYTFRPFTRAQALCYAEALMVEAGIPVASLEEVGRDEFYGMPDGPAGAVPAGATVVAHTNDRAEGG